MVSRELLKVSPHVRRSVRHEYHNLQRIPVDDSVELRRVVYRQKKRGAMPTDKSAPLHHGEQ
jgi:hypothetical protein